MARSPLLLLFLLACVTVFAPSTAAWAASDCGEVVTIATHGNTTTRYALARPAAPTRSEPVALVLLVGGGGHVDLDNAGCARALKGVSLLRQLKYFHDAGLITAVMDAPSDHFGDDGLAGFRIAAEHAQDIGKLIADVRARTRASVWVAGTSRGAISAVNAAARLSGSSAPDGLIITSALMSGAVVRKPWVTQTVFDLPLESIRVPVLVIGHAADRCPRSPVNLMDKITARTNSTREQVVAVTGGPGAPAPGVDACEGRSPHGFAEQEAEVAAGIVRFIRGEKY